MNVLRLIPCGLLALLALTWLPSDSGAQRPDEPCSCKKQDRLDLDSRIKKLTEAVKEYDNLIKQWQSKPPQKLTENVRAAEQAKVNAAMSKIQVAGATVYTGSMAKTYANCESEVFDFVPPCLRRSVQDHENKHKQRCLDHKDPDNNIILDWIKGTTDWRSNQTVVEYLQEEKSDHQGEIAILQAELSKMDKNCQQFTELDRSEKYNLEQALAQRERMDQAEKRVEEYGQSLI
jgi:hypothetical protein